MATVVAIAGVVITGLSRSSSAELVKASLAVVGVAEP
jgi:hypothetical protein